MDRFSKENIEKLVVAPKKGLMHKFRRMVGPIIDFSGLLGSVVLGIYYILFDQNAIVLVGIVLLLIVQLCFFYYIFIKFPKFKVNEYSIDLGLDKSIEFLFISDFHIGKEYSSTNLERLVSIVNKINELEPELVLLGGDFLTHDICPELINELTNIKCKNVFAVYGNHDADYLEDNIPYNLPTEFLNVFTKTNIPLLINEHREVELKGQKLTIAGIPDLYSKNFNIENALSGTDKNSLRILLSHNPDVIDFVNEEDNIDLILSGHNHSGQIFFPFIGAVLPMPTKRRWLTKGVFQVNNRTKLFLSQGIGYSGTRSRINTEAEICKIKLT